MKKHIPIAIILILLAIILWKLAGIEDRLALLAPSVQTETFEGKSYSYIPTKMPWEDAKLYSESLGGHLVTVESDSENKFIYDFVRRSGGYYSVWIGLSDLKQEGVWTWVTGSPVTYSNWFRNEPNGGKVENYVDLGYSAPYKWNDVDSNGRHGFVVEFDKEK